jgi:hypothetical protein
MNSNIPFSDVFNETQSVIVSVQHLTFIQYVQLFVALLGLYQILKTIWVAIKAARSKLYKPRFLRGEKFLYHYSWLKDSLVFREVRIKFEVNWRNKIILKATDLGNILKYTGYVKIEGHKPLFFLETEKIQFNGNKI